MILDFCLEHFDELDASWTRHALRSNGEVLKSTPAPLGFDAHQLHPFIGSSALQRVRDGHSRRDPAFPLPTWTAVQKPSPAEYARLISKGRILYEHCMAEVSHWCVIGFMHHELSKSLGAQRVMVDLMGWIVEQRLAMTELIPDEADEAVRRCAHTDYMLDQGVSFLLGLDRAQALSLAADKEP